MGYCRLCWILGSISSPFRTVSAGIGDPWIHEPSQVPIMKLSIFTGGVDPQKAHGVVCRLLRLHILWAELG